MGELGWELHHPMKQMESLYDAIYEVGKKDNIIQFWNICCQLIENGKSLSWLGSRING